VEGASVEIAEDGQAAEFAGDTGWTLSYNKLQAWDARGTTLPARMAPAPGGLAVQVDDTGAHYPITIDPLLTSPAWTADGGQQNANLGEATSNAGDVNGDGFDDIIVASNDYDNGQTNEGRAFVYLGSAAGLSTSPAWTAESDQQQALFGSSVSSAGDVNADGFDDIIVGAYLYDNGQTNEGRAFVYLGSAAGLSTSPAWTAESDQQGAQFGRSVSSAGDVNADGFDDVIVGARRYDNGHTNEGRAFVYLGSAAGLSTSPAWTAESDQQDAYFGVPVSSAGDVNADGFDDVIVGAELYDNGQTNEGRAFVYLGSAAGLSTSPAWTAEGDQQTAYFGKSVSSAGDVNADGFADVIVGAYLYDNGQTNEGRAFMYLGSASGLSTSAAWTAESDQQDANFGNSVSSAGDINGDGASDVIVAAYHYDNEQSGEGRVFVFYGEADTTTDPCEGVQCGADQACYAGTCFETCTADDDCSNPNEACYDQRCTNDPCEGVQCATDQACYAGTCFETCTGDDECSSPDDACYDQRCAADPCQGVQCSADQACYAGTCFETCTANDDCSNLDDACYDQRCATEPCEGVQCATDQACYAGTCFETCIANDECSNPDDACYDQRCAANPCQGVQCAVAKVCIEGSCADEVRGLHVTGGGVSCATSPTKPDDPSNLPWGLLMGVVAAAGRLSARLRVYDPVWC
jgi:Na+-transporting NADH:ubiquinone oxidoreductase subunit NqrB